MEPIKIYNPSGVLLFNDLVDDSSYRLREIMGDNRLDLRFSLPNYIEIPEDSYCDFMTERYWLPRALSYTKQHSEHFDYTLAMEGSIKFLKSTKLKFFDYLIENGKVKPTSSFKLKFPFTGTPRMFAELLVANLKLKHPQYDWQVGDMLESDPVTIDFNHDFCFNLLSKIADKDKFATEWELDKYTIHFRQVERLDDNGKKISFPLSYGYNNGILGGLKRTQYDNSKIINRVYIDSGDRNIDGSTYGRDRTPNGSDTLLLEKNKRITHEGIEYTTDASGSYVERVEPLAGDEDSLDISKHYPKRVGEVTSVEVIDDEQGLYNIIDLTIPEDLDYSKHIIGGETMTVIFQTGQLAGNDKEFDAAYNHAKRVFVLTPIERSGLIYPQGHLIPAVGDKYAVFHMRMPEQYITIAENDALQDVVKHLHKGEQAQYSYRWQLDGIHAKKNWGEIRGYLNIGYFVEFSDPQFLPEAVDVRIVAVKELINNPKSPEITIANNVSSKTLGAAINEIPTLEETVNRKDREVVSYVKRNFRQSNETMQKLIESMLDFEGSIKPIAVQTMMMLVGDESLQFRFVTERDNPQPVSSGIYFDIEDKRLVCPVGIMQHMTLGITSLSSSHAPSEYKFWDCKAYQSDVLAETAKSYFLYLKCSKADYSNAVYLISEDAIKMEAVEGYYHLLVGVLNSEDEDGNRSFIETFGFTEILPGRITTDKVVSADGQSYFDMLTNKLNFGNDESGFDWNVTKEDQFSIRGLINAIGAILGGFKIDNETFKSLKEQNGIPLILLNGVTGQGHLAAGSIAWDSEGNIERIQIDGGVSGQNIALGEWYTEKTTTALHHKYVNILQLYSAAFDIVSGVGVPEVEMKISPTTISSQLIGRNQSGWAQSSWGLEVGSLYEEDGFMRVVK